ncbi:hypothetical protein M9Y10_022363 [Tritrichomonas musculus]|uniref:Uncharacterized protein n=1 Tax=Tritrichomonas musculus TaxID=1915356 RepID=A0ABR2KS14_9EUKA
MLNFFLFFSITNDHSNIKRPVPPKHINIVLEENKIKPIFDVDNYLLDKDTVLNKENNSKEVNKRNNKTTEEKIISNKFDPKENKKKRHRNEVRNSKKNFDLNKNGKNSHKQMDEIADNINQLKAGLELLKIKNNFKPKNSNNQRNNDNQNKTSHKNKMAEILDQIRERYAPPTTPVSRITFGSVFLTSLFLIIIIAITYLMISRFFRIKSSEINEEELPFMLGQQANQEHDLSVHGFSKI